VLVADRGSRPKPADWIPDALATGRLQRLQPSMAAAGEMVNRARTHLRSAAAIADTDPTLALTACHDAARQAIAAHMRASGYRAANQAGAHRFVVEYAEIVLAAVIETDDAEALDVLRRDRHTAEYGDFASRVIKEQRARDALAVATRVVNAIASALAQPR
jgi:ornithine cyclodeaminase/alanine dehydrogenase-like protein (mu-crystallin family)